MAQRRVIALVAALAVLAAVGLAIVANDRTTPPTSQAYEEEVSATAMPDEPRTLTLSDGASVHVPAGAVERPVEMRLGRLASASPAQAFDAPAPLPDGLGIPVSTGYEFDASGYGDFSVPVRVTFPYDDSVVPDGWSQEHLVVIGLEDDGEWVPLLGDVDPDSSTVTIERAHNFGWFALVTFPISFLVQYATLSAGDEVTRDSDADYHAPRSREHLPETPPIFFDEAATPISVGGYSLCLDTPDCRVDRESIESVLGVPRHWSPDDPEAAGWSYRGLGIIRRANGSLLAVCNDAVGIPLFGGGELCGSTVEELYRTWGDEVGHWRASAVELPGDLTYESCELKARLHIGSRAHSAPSDGAVTFIAVTPTALQDCPPPSAQLDQSRAWLRMFGGPGTDTAGAVAVDASGVYVGGRTQGIGTAGSPDGVIRKYDFAGEEIWTETILGGESHIVSAMSTWDSSLYVGLEGGVLARYSSNANLEWAVQLPSSAVPRLQAIAVDDSGVYVGGSQFLGFSDGGAREQVDAFLFAYDHDGNLLWRDEFGVDELDEVTGVAVVGSQVFAVGRHAPSVQEEGVPDAARSFLRSYSTDGRLLWAVEDPMVGNYLDVAADTSGVYVVGDRTIVKYTVDGQVAWRETVVGNAYAAALGPSGISVSGVVGEIPGCAAAGDNDAFVAHHDRDGNLLWADQFGSAGYDHSYDVAVHDSFVYAVGYASGALPGASYLGEADIFVRSVDASGSGGVPCADVDDAVASPSSGVLHGEGIAAASFGDPMEESMELLVAALGPPTSDETYEDREGGFAGGFGAYELRYVSFGELLVWFVDGPYFREDGRMHLTGWNLYATPEDARTIATTTGITVGSTIGELRSAYPDVQVTHDEEGLCGQAEWTFGTSSGVYGDLDGPPDDTATRVFSLRGGAGGAC